jgi:Flp pilus assembly protein TadG
MLSPLRCAPGSKPQVRSWAGRIGATSVEFALVGGIFFMIVMGIVEIGRAFMVKHLLTNAAREGCRQGVLSGRSTAQITGVVNTTLTAQGISGDAASVQVNDGSADASTANSGDEITVKVSVPVSKITWIPGTNYLQPNTTLSSQYTLRRE